ncbi:MAG: DUF3842 family protein [Lachnospiraceae bacterium]
MVIDGQGGRIGSMFVEKWIKAGHNVEELVVVGTNSIATSSMIKSGARAAATGENPVVVNARTADYVVGPIGIMAADALLGEVTPTMAQAVATSPAKKVLIPMNTCDYIVVGVGDQKLSELIDEAVAQISGE